MTRQIYAGFDTFAYPGDDVILELATETNLKWMGFYLGPAPSNKGTTFMRKRGLIASFNLGMLPIYVGRQITGPGSKLSVAVANAGTQGITDGRDAANLMKVAGFKAGSRVYLDLENGVSFTAPESNYVRSWSAAVRANGYRADVYCSFQMAPYVHTVLPDARVWAFHVPTTKQHRVPGRSFPTPDPASCGYAGASQWQLADSCLIDTLPGRTLLVDLSSSVYADPSAP